MREKIADGALIAKWRKPGYEILCSMLAIQKGNHNFGTTSHCRRGPLCAAPARSRTPVRAPLCGPQVLGVATYPCVVGHDRLLLHPRKGAFKPLASTGLGCTSGLVESLLECTLPCVLAGK